MLTVAVVVVVGLGFFYGLVRNTLSDDSAGVTLSVMFEPKDRVLAVEISVKIDGVVDPLERTKRSPWTRVVILRKGQTVTLTATQSVPAKLSCAVNGEAQETKAFPGTVTCIHKRA